MRRLAQIPHAMIALKVCPLVSLILKVRTVNGFGSFQVFNGIYAAWDQSASADFNDSCAFQSFLSAFRKFDVMNSADAHGIPGARSGLCCKKKRDVLFSVRLKVFEISEGVHPLDDSICVSFTLLHEMVFAPLWSCCAAPNSRIRSVETKQKAVYRFNFFVQLRKYDFNASKKENLLMVGVEIDRSVSFRISI